MLDILYLGPLVGSSLERADAYRRLGHKLTHLDPRRFLPATPWVDRIAWRLGGGIFSAPLRQALAATLIGKRFDLCHVDSGEYITASVIEMLRKHCPAVVNYNLDDPFGSRDGRRFAAYRSAVRHYDLVVVVRPVNVAEAKALGARRVLFARRCADEVAHAPLELGEVDRKTWGAPVVFVGTWMPERGPFLRELLQRGVPLSIRGTRWQKAPEWPDLQAAYKGGAVYGQDYVKAIQGGYINLGLLSKGNRDDHTQRSLEVPALGSVLCAERTPDHVAMYKEGEEAVFWSTAEECAQQCLSLLADDRRRAAIALAGQRRVHANQDFNEPMLRSVLAALQRPDAAATAS